MQADPHKKSIRNNQKKQLLKQLFMIYEPKTHYPRTDQISHTFQTLLQTKPENRNSKLLKKIKSQLHQLKCFRFSDELRSKSPEIEEIFIRDQKFIIQLIANFVELEYYGQGEVMEIAGTNRDSIKIVLCGVVAIFEPSNSKSLKNCTSKSQNKQYNFDIIRNRELLLKVATSEKIPEDMINLNEVFMKTFLTEQNPEQKIRILKANITDLSALEYSDSEADQTIQQIVHKDSSEYPQIKPLTLENAAKLLAFCGVMTLTTPHKISSIRKQQDLISSINQPQFLDLKTIHTVSAVCMSDCLCLEISYKIARQIIKIVNNDKQKIFLKALLVVFPMLSYFQAKNYLSPECMISKLSNKETEEDAKQINLSEALAQIKVISSEKSEISYNKNLYLVVEGKVTLVIDLILQRKSSTNQLYIPHKKYYPKQILTLTKNDLFGLQEIGETTSLRYAFESGSSILKFRQDQLDYDSLSMPDIKKVIEKTFEDRNRIVKQKIRNMQKKLEEQEIRRYRAMNNGSKLRMMVQELGQNNLKQQSMLKKYESIEKFPEIKEVRYFANSDFNSMKTKINQYFSPQNKVKPKQYLSVDIVNSAGLGVQFSNNLALREGQKVEIKEGWIMVRNKNDKLIRKKRIVASSLEKQFKKPKKGSKDSILEKIGILNAKQIADHNMKIVKKRKSAYKFEDIRKDAKQIRRLHQKSKSLPKIQQFFAKKQDKLFSINKVQQFY